MAYDPPHERLFDTMGRAQRKGPYITSSLAHHDTEKLIPSTNAPRAVVIHADTMTPAYFDIMQGGNND